jgi:gas vesicle protein
LKQPLESALRIIKLISVIVLTMNNNGKIILALLAGAAVGAALGILFAPDKGSATREKIKRKAGDIADDLEDAIEKAKEALEDLKEVASDQAEKYADDLNEQLKTILK